MSRYNITPGSVLLASTKLDGSAWHRTLVMPINVSNRVTAIIINQVSTVSVDVLGFDLPHTFDNVPIYLGGPVKPRDLNILHSADWETDSTTVFYNRVGVTNDADSIDLFKAGQIPEYYRIIAGSVWWTMERLSTELSQKLWIPISMSSASILAVPASEQWEFVLSELSKKAVDGYF